MFTQKVLIFSLGFFVSLTLLMGCNKKVDTDTASATQISALENMIQRGEIRVGYVAWNPAVIKDATTGELSGIYPDMIQNIADVLKLKVSWHQTTLANFAAGLQSQQYDFSVGPTFITIPRSIPVAFTQPVAYVGNSAVVKTGLVPPRTVKEIETRKLKVAVLQGQAMDEFFKRRYPNIELLILAGSDLTAPLAAVSSNQADIGFMNSVTVNRYTNEHPELGIAFAEDSQLELLPLAWATRQNDLHLHRFLESTLTYLKMTGRLEEIQKKYKIQLLYDTPRLHTAK